MSGPTTFLVNLSRAFPGNARVNAMRRALSTSSNKSPNQRYAAVEAAVMALATAHVRNAAKTAELVRAWRRYQAWHRKHADAAFRSNKKRKRAPTLNNLPDHLVRAEVLARLNNRNVASLASTRRNAARAMAPVLTARRSAMEREMYEAVDAFRQAPLAATQQQLLEEVRRRLARAPFERVVMLRQGLDGHEISVRAFTRRFAVFGVVFSLNGSVEIQVALASRKALDAFPNNIGTLRRLFQAIPFVSVLARGRPPAALRVIEVDSHNGFRAQLATRLERMLTRRV